MANQREKRTRRSKPNLRTAGWREWVRLPDLGIGPVKAKLDTGARSSCLHAFAVEQFERDGRDMVRFRVHPLQRDSETTMEAEAELIDRRMVRNSGGHSELRPVIRTELELGDERWPIELTLTRRDEMGFRMLLGRQAVRTRFTVDAGSSFRISTSPTIPRKKKLKSATPTKSSAPKKKRTAPKKTRTAPEKTRASPKRKRTTTQKMRTRPATPAEDPTES